LVDVNDVVLTSTTAWFTDSHDALPYGLQLDVCGTPPGPDAVIRLPLTGELVVDPAAINANDIVRTPEDRTLLIVQPNAGLLLRRIRVLAGPSRSTPRRDPYPTGPGCSPHPTSTCRPPWPAGATGATCPTRASPRRRRRPPLHGGGGPGPDATVARAHHGTGGRGSHGQGTDRSNGWLAGSASVI
jgi:hypothetical protein